MNTRLRNKNGTLYVTRDYGQDTPGGVIRYWYSTEIRACNFAEVPENGFSAVSIDSGRYDVDIGKMFPVTVTTLGGGRRAAAYSESWVVPAPKIRGNAVLSWDPVRIQWMKVGKSTHWNPVPA